MYELRKIHHQGHPLKTSNCHYGSTRLHVLHDCCWYSYHAEVCSKTPTWHFQLSGSAKCPVRTWCSQGGLGYPTSSTSFSPLHFVKSSPDLLFGCPQDLKRTVSACSSSSCTSRWWCYSASHLWLTLLELLMFVWKSFLVTDVWDLGPPCTSILIILNYFIS